MHTCLKAGPDTQIPSTSEEGKGGLNGIGRMPDFFSGRGQGEDSLGPDRLPVRKRTSATTVGPVVRGHLADTPAGRDAGDLDPTRTGYCRGRTTRYPVIDGWCETQTMGNIPARSAVKLTFVICPRFTLKDET